MKMKAKLIFSLSVIFMGSLLGELPNSYAEVHMIGVYQGHRPSYDRNYGKMIERFEREAREKGMTEEEAWEYVNEKQHRATLKNPGKVTVEISRTGVPIDLVLTAYEPVDWRIKIKTGVTLRSVIYSGYHRQRVNLPRKLKGIRKIKPSSSAYFYFNDSLVKFLPDGENGCTDSVTPFQSGYLELTSDVLDLTKELPASTQGFYESKKITVSDGTVGKYLSPLRESGYCYMNDQGLLELYQGPNP